MTMETSRPSDLELQVLSVLWRKGPATVRDVLGSIPDGRARAYTTILSTMQVMEKKGLLERAGTKGLTHVYKPAVTRRQVLGPLLRNLVKNIFGGSPLAAVQHLLRETEVSEQDLSEIDRLLDEERAHRKGKERKGAPK
jgi:BlaI family transcriptional regulator, penicillinase repressor